MSHSADKLLERYIELHNLAIVCDDRRAVEALLADGFACEVEGPALSSLRRQAIVSSFQRQEVVLWRIGRIGDDVAFASYAWRSSPRIGGHIRIQKEGERIGRLILRPGYSRIFSVLSCTQESAASNPFLR